MARYTDLIKRYRIIVDICEIFERKILKKNDILILSYKSLAYVAYDIMLAKDCSYSIRKLRDSDRKTEDVEERSRTLEDERREAIYRADEHLKNVCVDIFPEIVRASHKYHKIYINKMKSSQKVNELLTEMEEIVENKQYRDIKILREFMDYLAEIPKEISVSVKNKKAYKRQLWWDPKVWLLIAGLIVALITLFVKLLKP